MCVGMCVCGGGGEGREPSPLILDEWECAKSEDDWPQISLTL